MNTMLVEDLLRACEQKPGSDELKLILADALEEAGDPEHLAWRWIVRKDRRPYRSNQMSSPAFKFHGPLRIQANARSWDWHLYHQPENSSRSHIHSEMLKHMTKTGFPCVLEYPTQRQAFLALAAGLTKAHTAGDFNLLEDT